MPWSVLRGLGIRSPRLYTMPRSNADQKAAGAAKKKRRRPPPTPSVMARQEQVNAVQEETQQLLNNAFDDGTYKYKFRFEEGETVICQSKGFYHEATVCTYFHSMAPALSEEKQHEQNWIPTVIVQWSGYSSKYNEEIPENEVISCIPKDLCHIQGMLLAHEWNTLHRERLGVSEADIGKSTWFFVDPDKHREVDAIWRAATGSIISFAQHCGREEVTDPATLFEVDLRKLWAQS